MTRLSWDAIGERLYETGVDRGVLYVEGYPGVAWTGLTAVSESPSGGEATAYYLDGVKYLNVVSLSEFAATLSALYYPELFEECDGLSSVGGFYVTDQPRKSFGLCYRTRLGNDLEGFDYGYKIHLVYNAYVSVSSREFESINDSIGMTPFSWPISTRPLIVPGYRPASHFIIDSTKVSPETLETIEDILYGADGVSARLPTVDELLAIFIPLSDLDTGGPESIYIDTYDGGIPSSDVLGIDTYTDALDGGTV
jgi:hypothetical protein